MGDPLKCKIKFIQYPLPHFIKLNAFSCFCIAEDTTLEINVADPNLCSNWCTAPNENDRVYFGVQKTQSNFYKCKCLSRDQSIILGSINGFTESPLNAITCSDNIMKPKLALVDQNTALINFLKNSQEDLKTTDVRDNSSVINICNPNRTTNIITLYLSHFLGLDANSIISNFVYEPSRAYDYPGNVTNAPTADALFPNLRQAFWTIVSQVILHLILG